MTHLKIYFLAVNLNEIDHLSQEKHTLRSVILLSIFIIKIELYTSQTKSSLKYFSF